MGADRFTLVTGDCRVLLADLPDACVDFVLTDPPYPEINREYGRWTEEEWFTLMREVVPHVRRILRPHGSAIFIVQPGSNGIGRMRPWVWDFCAWLCREWNLVQDAYWWNLTGPPVGGAPSHGLMRPSVKWAVWCGNSDCYRSQDAVLWLESDGNRAIRSQNRFLGRAVHPSGRDVHDTKARTSAARRFGVTPFNLMPFGGAGGSGGHPAATPVPLCEWWIRYCTRKGAIVLDPFSGAASVGVAALRLGRHYLGFEKRSDYNQIGRQRLLACLEEKPVIG